ncbi:MAG TPA: signal peptidase I [Methylotenera sp.]|nr:signal peptidase I [Methylotenera sp.]
MYFALFMVVILAVTGLIWLLDILVLRKNRLVGVDEPWYVEYAKSFFPVILLVFVLRSFLVEPFKIPSGSMMPTLLAGDYILVNKFTYGLRVPILNYTFIEMNKPKAGDVIVFHYPPDPKIDYIKRVVGVPGDKIQYQDKQLIINGKKLDVTFENDYEYAMQGANIISARKSKEQLGDVRHDILVHDIPNQYNPDMPGAKLQDGETITVPEGSYFAMGDNRDNSADSRVWGFVPEHNLVGKAFYIWMNFDQFSRIGNAIK